MKFMLGVKGRMTQIFDDKGTVSAVTIVTATPMKVTQVKTVEKDGYQREDEEERGDGQGERVEGELLFVDRRRSRFVEG